MKYVRVFYIPMFVVVLAMLADFGGYIDLVDKFSYLFAYSDEGSPIRIRLPVKIVVLLYFVTTIVLIVAYLTRRKLYIRLSMRIARRIRIHASKKQILFKRLYEKQQENLRLFSSSPFGTNNRTAYNLKRVVVDTIVDKEMTAFCSESITIVATDHICSFWHYTIFGDVLARPATSLEDLELLVTIGGRECAVMLTRDNPTEKGIFIGIIPPLKMGEEATIKLSYKWKGIFEALKVRGHEPYFWMSESMDAYCIGDIHIRHTFSNEIGRVICRPVKPQIIGENLKLTTTNSQTIWETTLEGIDLGRGREVEINFSVY